jgi:hypothetical protein
LFTPGLVVTTNAASGAGSLNAIAASAPNGAAITFAPALNGQTIYLNGTPIELGSDVTIDASGLPNGIRIDGGGQSRVFFVDGGVTAVLNWLTIQNGNVSGDPSTGGGGIAADQCTLTVNNCAFISNLDIGSLDGGGAIHSLESTLTVNNCTFLGNQGLDTQNNNGGGTIFAFETSTTVSGCTMVSNQADSGAKSPKLAAAFRGARAPVLALLEASASEQDFLDKATAHYRDWNPARVASVVEEALQLAAAKGAIEQEKAWLNELDQI